MDIFIQAINAAIVAEMQKPQETPAAFVLSLLQERAMRAFGQKFFVPAIKIFADSTCKRYAVVVRG
jgi:hypothetical protein